MQPVPFVIYADFEALTEKVYSCQPSEEKSYTTRYQSHLPCGYGYEIVCHADQSYSRTVEIYRGEDAVEKFIEKIFREVQSCQEVMKKHFKKPLIMSKENELDFQNSTRCYICGKNIQIKIILSSIKVKRLN